MSNQTTVRPFRVEVPEEDLVELRRRIAATRWPEKEPVADASQGVQLATMQALARYWETEYDFGRLEARLKALPQFLTEIDGLDIHFIHVRSPHEHALPLILRGLAGAGPLHDRDPGRVPVPASVSVDHQADVSRSSPVKGS